MACIAQIIRLVLMTALGAPVHPEVIRYFTTLSADTFVRAGPAPFGSADRRSPNRIAPSGGLSNAMTCRPGAASAAAKAVPSSANRAPGCRFATISLSFAWSVETRE